MSVDTEKLKELTLKVSQLENRVEELEAKIVHDQKRKPEPQVISVNEPPKKSSGVHGL